MLKISLLFKESTNFTGKNSKVLKIKNAKLSEYYFYINLNVWGGFEICISVPLRYADLIRHKCYHLKVA